MGFSAPQRGTQSRSVGPKIGPTPSGNPLGQSSSAVPLQFATIMTPSPGPCSSHRWNTDGVLRFVDVRHVHVLTAEPAGVPAPVETEGDRVAIEADQAMELLLQVPVQRNVVADELPHFVAPTGREPPQRVLGAAVVSEARCPSCRSPASRRTARGPGRRGRTRTAGLAGSGTSCPSRGDEAPGIGTTKGVPAYLPRDLPAFRTPQTRDERTAPASGAAMKSHTWA